MRVSPAALVPLTVAGTTFWVLVIVAAATGNDDLITAALVLGAAMALVAIAVGARRRRAVRQIRDRILAEGRPADARIVRASANGARNRNPYIEFDLEVTLPGEEPYRVGHRALVSQLAVARIQRDAVIDVFVDPGDRYALVIDPSVTGTD